MEWRGRETTQYQIRVKTGQGKKTNENTTKERQRQTTRQQKDPDKKKRQDRRTRRVILSQQLASKQSFKCVVVRLSFRCLSFNLSVCRLTLILILTLTVCTTVTGQDNHKTRKKSQKTRQSKDKTTMRRAIPRQETSKETTITSQREKAKDKTQKTRQLKTKHKTRLGKLQGKTKHRKR